MKFELGSYAKCVSLSNVNRGGGGWATIQVGAIYRVLNTTHPTASLIQIQVPYLLEGWWVNRENFTPVNTPDRAKSLNPVPGKDIFGV